MSKPQLGRGAEAKRYRLDFATACVAAVFPGVRDERQPKRVIFEKAAVTGTKRKECPLRFRKNPDALQTYIINHWSAIRLNLPERHDILPCYVNGADFGEPGGYRKGNAKLAEKQVERDAKIADGVVSAANDFAKATVGLFPQVETVRRELVTQRLGR